jgi:hypothetical protein
MLELVSEGWDTEVSNLINYYCGGYHLCGLIPMEWDYPTTLISYNLSKVCVNIFFFQ